MLPEPVSAINSNSNESNLQNFIDEGMEDSHDNQINGENSGHASTSNTPKELKFNIHHNYTSYNITISDRLTIGSFIINFQCHSFQYSIISKHAFHFCIEHHSQVI